MQQTNLRRQISPRRVLKNYAFDDVRVPEHLIKLDTTFQDDKALNTGKRLPNTENELVSPQGPGYSEAHALPPDRPGRQRCPGVVFVVREKIDTIIKWSRPNTRCKRCKRRKRRTLRHTLRRRRNQTAGHPGAFPWTLDSRGGRLIKGSGSFRSRSPLKARALVEAVRPKRLHLLLCNFARPVP